MSVSDELKAKYVKEYQEGGKLKPLVSEHRDLLLPLLFRNEELASAYRTIASCCPPSHGRICITPAREETKDNEVIEHPGEIIGQISTADDVVSVTLMSTLLMYNVRCFEDAIVAVMTDAVPSPIEQLALQHVDHGKYEVQQVPPGGLIYLVQERPQKEAGHNGLLMLKHIAWH